MRLRLLLAMLAHLVSHGIGWRRSSCWQRTTRLAAASTLPHSATQSPTPAASPRPVVVRSLPLNIYVDAEVRAHLSMRNSDRKARIFLPQHYIEELESHNKIATIGALRAIIEKKFVSLQDKPYVLRYTVPTFNTSPSSSPTNVKRQFQSDTDVHAAIKLATATEDIPSIQLYVDPLPGVFPPPSETYLAGMQDPDESTSFTVLSFYRFFDIPRPEEMAEKLEQLWRPFRAVGRIYVAREGVNAQMAVPSNVLPNFHAACSKLDLLRDLYLNCDHTLSRQEFEETRPFKALHIRVRDQIVTDGFAEPLDWHKSGREMAPLEWHSQLDNPSAVVLDCRNSYESDVGVFQNAKPLSTTFFRESWDALEETLKDTPKDAPIMTYCTGGIRCVKINAYLEQKMGFTNVARLQGGIISYSRELEREIQSSSDSPLLPAGQQSRVIEAVEGEGEGVGEIEQAKGLATHHLQRNVQQSKFKGTNYVFDERMGARITDDILSTCETCGSSSDAFTNCANFQCHVRFIQCSACRGSYGGCCSVYCQQEHSNALQGGGGVGSRAMIPRVKTAKVEQQQQEMQAQQAAAPAPAEQSVNVYTPPQQPQKRGGDDHTQTERKEHASSMDAQLDALQTYCERQSEPEPALLAALRAETKAVFGSHARMISGHLQGRLLTMLTRLTRAKNVLELGTFTGYSALCFAEGGGRVISCDIDEQAHSVAKKYIQESPYADRIDLRVQPAIDVLQQARSEQLTFDIVFVDADKKAYQGYILELLGLGLSGLSGSNQCLLSDGALILVDNTLWKGLVLAHDDELKEHSPEARLYGNAKRMEALSLSMHEFNTWVRETEGLTQVILPLRDGLSAIRFTRSPTL